MVAAKVGDLDVVNYLIEKGANVYLRDRNGDTAIMIANENDQTDVALVLRRAGAKNETKPKKVKTAPAPVDDDEDDDVDDSADVDELISDDPAPDDISPDDEISLQTTKG